MTSLLFHISHNLTLYLAILHKLLKDDTKFVHLHILKGGEKVFGIKKKYLHETLTSMCDSAFPRAFLAFKVYRPESSA